MHAKILSRTDELLFPNAAAEEEEESCVSPTWGKSLLLLPRRYTQHTWTCDELVHVITERARPHTRPLLQTMLKRSPRSLTLWEWFW